MVAQPRGKSVEIGLRPGAINRQQPWRLDVGAVAEDSAEPLITHPESAGDTAVLRQLTLHSDVERLKRPLLLGEEHEVRATKHIQPSSIEPKLRQEG